jgi:hypothetical protein
VALFAAGWFGQPLVRPAVSGAGAGTITAGWADGGGAVLAAVEFTPAAWPGLTLESVRVEGCLAVAYEPDQQPPDAAAEAPAEAAAEDQPSGRLYCGFQPSAVWLAHENWTPEGGGTPAVSLQAGSTRATVALETAAGEKVLGPDSELPQRLHRGEPAMLLLLWEFSPGGECDPDAEGRSVCEIWDGEDATNLVIDLTLRSVLGIERLQRVTAP